MHLRDHEIEAFLRVGLIIEDELPVHVVQLEKFYSHLVAIRDHQLKLLLSSSTHIHILLLKLLHLIVEVLQRIDEGFEFEGAAVAHLAERLHACAQARIDPDRLQHAVQKAVVLVALVSQAELLPNLRACLHQSEILRQRRRGLLVLLVLLYLLVSRRILSLLLILLLV